MRALKLSHICPVRKICHPFFQSQLCTTSLQRKLIQSIKTMNWTIFRPYPNLTSEQIAILTTPGPNEHPHSALLPPKHFSTPLSPLFVSLRFFSECICMPFPQFLNYSNQIFIRRQASNLR